MRITCILNPSAGNGRAGKSNLKMKTLLKSAGLDAKVITTKDAIHSKQVAKEAAITSDIVVAVGGDGTIHQVANGIICSESNAVLGIIPFGTGNDFVKMLDIPFHLESAIKILAKGKRKVVDYGTVHYRTKSDDGACFFLNTLGIGFDAEVGHRASSFKVLPGVLAYLAALFKTLRALRYTEAQIILDDNSENLFYQGRFLLSSVGNGSTSGGLFKLTPNAKINDGWFDVCAIDSISVGRLLLSIPRVLRGTHVNMRQYHAGRAKKVAIQLLDDAFRVTTASGLPVHADGEILAHDVHRLEVQIVEKGISVIVP
ncbi:MAG: diacylglycerol kinase family protein [Rhodothermales bacterium]